MTFAEFQNLFNHCLLLDLCISKCIVGLNKGEER